MSGTSYVILEWNQASGLPRLVDTELYDEEHEAVEQAHQLTLAAAPRRERYTVHPVDLDDRVPWRACPTCKGKGGWSGVGPGEQDADCGTCCGHGVQLHIEEAR